MDDFAGASADERCRWVQLVERRCQSGWVFRWVFRFESRFLAYSRKELESIVDDTGLYGIAFSMAR